MLIQTCQLSLIQSETQAIVPSKIRTQSVKSENIAPVLTSFMYVIIEQNFEKIVPFLTLT